MCLLLHSQPCNPHKTHLDGGKHEVHGCTLSWSQTSGFFSSDMLLEGYQIKSNTRQLAKQEQKLHSNALHFKLFLQLLCKCLMTLGEPWYPRSNIYCLQNSTDCSQLNCRVPDKCEPCCLIRVLKMSLNYEKCVFVNSN